MGKRNLGALVATSAVLALLWPDPAVRANSGITHSLKVGQILVANDGQGYVSVAPFEWDAEITVDAGDVGRVKSWRYWVTLNVEGQPDLSLKAFSASASFGATDRPKVFRGNIGRVVSKTFSESGWFSVENWALLACRRQASAWRDKGWSDEQIFAREHIVAVQYRDDFEAEFTVDNYLDIIVEGSPPRFTEIVCQRAPANLEKKPAKPPRPATNDLAVPFSISSALIKVEPSKVTGPCPIVLKVTAELVGVGAGTASFRLVHNGAPGPVRKVTFKKGGTKSDTATFEVGKPAKGPALESAGGGGGSPQAGAQMKAPTSPNQHAGHFAIRVATPNKVESDEAFYSVICKPRPAVETPTTLAVPRPPAGASGGETPMRGRPDLEVVSAHSQGGSLSLVVRNAGAAAAPKSTLALVCVQRGQARSWKTPVPALPAGATRRIETRPPAGRPTRSDQREGCRIEVDPGDAIAEANERNNGLFCPECSAGRGGGRR